MTPITTDKIALEINSTTALKNNVELEDEEIDEDMPPPEDIVSGVKSASQWGVRPTVIRRKSRYAASSRKTTLDEKVIKAQEEAKRSFLLQIEQQHSVMNERRDLFEEYSYLVHNYSFAVNLLIY